MGRILLSLHLTNKNCGAMAAVSETQIFGRSGPSFFTAIDWNNPYHRRSVAASLVQGVYVLEHDRQHNRQGPQSLAPLWWEFFNFRLKQVLVDEHDDSYFGAIFEFKFPYDPYYGYSNQRPPPQYVIAFRGIINKSGNREQDFKLVFRCILNDLQNSTRLHKAIESAQDVLYRAVQGNVWLAGHSLGSSIALIIGREMAKNTGTHLDTYLFNPPFVSPPIGRIKDENLRFGLRFTISAIKALLAVVAHGGHSPNAGENDPFILLSSWFPYLFLNPFDLICSEYIDYFEHREKMESICAGKIEHLATQHSLRGTVSGAIGKDFEAIHLIPSAYLTINSTPNQSFIDAHGIEQWWRQDFEFLYKLYHFK